MNKSTVLFFDSGMGGLSVYREAKKLMPDNHYLYALTMQVFLIQKNQKKQSFSEHWIFVKKLIRIIHLMPL